MNELLSALSNVVGKIDDCVYDLEDVRDMVEEARDAIDYDETEDEAEKKRYEVLDELYYAIGEAMNSLDSITYDLDNARDVDLEIEG